MLQSSPTAAIAALSHFSPELFWRAAALRNPLLEESPMGIQRCWPPSATSTFWKVPADHELAYRALVDPQRTTDGSLGDARAV